VGLGLVGQLTAQPVRAASARAVGMDISPRRAEFARRLGTTSCADPDELEEIVHETSGGVWRRRRHLDGCRRRRQTSRTRGQRCARSSDRRRSGRPPALDPSQAVLRQGAPVTALEVVWARPLRSRLRGARTRLPYRPSPLDGAPARQLVPRRSSKRDDLTELITHEFPIERAVEAYATLSNPDRLAVMLRYGSQRPKPLRRVATHAPPPRRAGRLRVGLLGPGAFARSTLLLLLQSLDVELVGIGGRTPARAVGLARRTGAAFATADADDLLSDESIDVVVIATRRDSHASLAAQALERGKSVFLEKPLAIDDEGLARLEPLLDAGGRVVVDFNRSFAPATARVASHFGGRATEPVFVSCRVNAGYLEPDHWLRDPRTGGGRLVGEACHFVDLCSTLTGSMAESLQVVGLGRGPSSLEHDTFDLTLRYDGGSVASVSYVAVGSNELPKERIEVFGGARAAVIDDFRRVVLLPRRRGVGGRGSPGRQDKGHAGLLRASFEFFQRGGEPPIPYDRLLETTRVTFAARVSLHRRFLGAVRLDAAE
jgi:predicted dehydrogenase